MPLDKVDTNNREDVFVNDNNLYGKETKTVPKPQSDISIDNKQFLDNIVNACISSQLDISALQSFTRVSQSRNQIYDTIDTMCEDSMVAAILETYAEDATEYNDQGQVIWAEAEDANVLKYINYLLETMRIDKHIYKWVHSLCKYGDVYLRLYRESEFNKNDIFEEKNNLEAVSNIKSRLNKLQESKLNNNDKSKLNEDVVIKAYAKSDHYVPYLELMTNPAEMFELTKFGKTAGYIKANVKQMSSKSVNSQNITLQQYKFKKDDVTVFSATEFVHACLEDDSNRIPEEVDIFLDNASYDSDSNAITYTVKRGQSLFQNAFKIWRELSLLENSVMLNRITKSAVIRLINVEVGDMPKEMIGPHLQGIKSLMEQKAAINEGNSLNEYTNPGPIENNIYVPVNGGKGAITTSTVGGDFNVGDLVDLDYFKNKFFGAMRVPKQFFGDTDDGAGFNGGQSLSIISSRYAKMIKRIQNTIIQAITDAINLMLLDRGLDNYIGKFSIRMLPPTTQEQIDRRENVSSKIQLTRDTMDILSDIDDPITKLKILKSLLSDIITDGDVISTIQEFIDKTEAELNVDNSETDSDNSMHKDSSNRDYSYGNSNDGSDDDIDSSEPLDLDGSNEQDSDLSSAIDSYASGTEQDEENLPSPDELGVGDLSDNNNPDLS